MKIKDNTLISISENEDVDNNGTFVFLENITSIDNFTFANCVSLKNIVIPENIVHIVAYAFLSCTSLKDVSILNSFTQIDNAAFRKCTSINNFTIGSVDVLKVYKLSKQSINGTNFKLCCISDAAALATFNDFYLHIKSKDNFTHIMRYSFKNSENFLNNSTNELKQYTQECLLPLIAQIHRQRYVK